MKRYRVARAICLLSLVTLVVALDAAARAGAAPVAEIRTPKPPETPRINGSAIFGVRPGNPFLYRIPATGARPMEFSVESLPAGLHVDAKTGQVTGSLKEAGEHLVTVRAKNALGTSEKKFMIVVGETIALTPPMGWNSWNAYHGSVTGENVIHAARAMAASGLIQHGWTYVNIPRGQTDPQGPPSDRWAPYAGPGHWNDPDMMVLGMVNFGGKQHPTRLTPDEQYLHMTQWCMACAPLLLGCNLDKLDEFTLNLITNDEVLAVNQDTLGKQTTLTANENNVLLVYAKDLEDGAKAVALYNLSKQPATVTAGWSDLRLSGKQMVRDLWRQKDLGEFVDRFQMPVVPHGAELVKIRTAR